jgi:TilS substrate binding domain
MLEALTAARLAELGHPLAGGGLAVDRAAWQRLPRALQRRLLRRALLALRGRLEDVRDSPIEDALTMLNRAPGVAHYDLPGGIVLTASAHELCIQLRPVGVDQRARNTRSGAEPCV